MAPAATTIQPRERAESSEADTRGQVFAGPFVVVWEASGALRSPRTGSAVRQGAAHGVCQILKEQVHDGSVERSRFRAGFQQLFLATCDSMP